MEAKAVEGWNERMRICTYICLHWAIDGQSCVSLKKVDAELKERRQALAHSAYIHSLPPASSLLTPFHWYPDELDLLRGTNLAGAVIDQGRVLIKEHETIRETLKIHELTW